MRFSFYQLNNHSFIYTRRWYEKQGSRRLYDTVKHHSTGDSIRLTRIPTLGFKQGYEFGYSLGII